MAGERQRIAVATRDWVAVAGHAGRARKWLVFEAQPGRPARETQRVELAEDQVFHFHKSGAHPLDGVRVLIAASAGDGFFRHAQKLGMALVLTAEPNAAKAVADHLASTLAPPKSRGLMGLVCKVRDLFSEQR